jgi:hypothetical protein
MAERAERSDGAIGVLADREGEGGECDKCRACSDREASSHLPGQNVWDALTGHLPTIEISDADYRSLHFPCDALKE